MKKGHSSLAVWDEAVNDVEKSQKTKYSITKDMVQRRLRPEPEIIEHILEDLETKIRYYFNLFRLEKEKRTAAEKNNYYLQEELVKLHETFEKSKMYTMKLEDKLKRIKGNQSSLIDTVRSIDLLYIQLDTLVQSFAGVCTQTAADTVDADVHLRKKQQTIQMLLDYIYPCRTLDPRINALYGLLYYQTIGLLNGKYEGPPVPPIPPVVPSESNGWLPPSPLLFQPDHLNEKGKTAGEYNNTDGTDISKSNSANSYSDGVTRYSSSSHDYKNQGDGSGSRELLGFDIKIGIIELRFDLENPKIVCVVRYDHETAYAAIQNSKRITKPQVPYEITEGQNFKFKINSTINLNSLPPKKPGIVPKFKIDIHDVKGKTLVGTAKCSFVNEKTLIPNTPWDIYSRTSKEQPDIIGKIYVTVFPYPSKAKLPAESFKDVKMGSAVHVNSSLNGFDGMNSSQTITMNEDAYNEIGKLNSSSSGKSIIKKSSAANAPNSSVKIGKYVLKPAGQKMVSFKDPTDINTKEPKFVPQGLKQTKIKQVGAKPKMTVTFKPYSSKGVTSTETMKSANTEKSGNFDSKGSTNTSGLLQTDKTQNSQVKSKFATTIKSTIEKIEPSVTDFKTFDILKKPASTSDIKIKGTNISNVKMLINKISKASNNLNKQNEPLSNLKAPAKTTESAEKQKSSIEEKADEKNNVRDPMKVKLPYFTKKDVAVKALINNEKLNESMSKGTDTASKTTSDVKVNTSDTKIMSSQNTKSSQMSSKQKSNSDSITDKQLPINETDKKTISTGNIPSKTNNESLLKPAIVPPDVNKSGALQTLLKKSTDISKTGFHSKTNSSTKTDLSVKSLPKSHPSAESLAKSKNVSSIEKMQSETKENANLTEPPETSKFAKKVPPSVNSAHLKTSLPLKTPLPLKTALPLKTPLNLKNSTQMKNSIDSKNSNGSKDSKDSKELNKSTMEGTKATEKFINKPIINLKKSLIKFPPSVGMKKGGETFGKKSAVEKAPLLKKTPEIEKKENDASNKPSVSPNTKLSILKTPQNKSVLNADQKNKSPIVTTSPLEHIDSDDIQIKQALLQAQKKSVFIDKNKIKQFVLKPKEQKRVIKKFTPKFKAALE